MTVDPDNLGTHGRRADRARDRPVGGVGLLVGRWVDGALDLSSLTGSGRDRSR